MEFAGTQLQTSPTIIGGKGRRVGQNISSAVMQQRREPHDSLDFFPTPLWVTRALCEYVLGGKSALEIYDVWEPACGEGHMARALSEYFGVVHASDVHDYGYGTVQDFLMPGSRPSDSRTSPDFIITNPPFRLASQFVKRAQAISTKGCAMLTRIAFLESVGRYKELFSEYPPTIIAQFTERVPMFKGRLDRHGSTATAYCWLTWTWNNGGSEFRWIPPCRKRLERDEDYL